METLTKENYFIELSKAWLEKSKKWKFDYSSWSDVWDFLKKNVSDARFEWCENKDGWLGFVDDFGCFAKVKVWSESLGVEVTQHLHAMNFSNQAVQRDQLTASDINKTYQRCMVKAIATWFGLGLYIYKWEDLPDESDWSGVKKEKTDTKNKTDTKPKYFNYEDLVQVAEAGNKTLEEIGKVIKEDWYTVSPNAKKAIVEYVNTWEINKDTFFGK